MREYHHLCACVQKKGVKTDKYDHSIMADICENSSEGNLVDVAPESPQISNNTGNLKCFDGNSSEMLCIFGGYFVSKDRFQ